MCLTLRLSPTPLSLARQGKKLFPPKQTPMPRDATVAANPRLPLTQLSWQIISGGASIQSDRCLVHPYRPNEALSRQVAGATTLPITCLNIVIPLRCLTTLNSAPLSAASS